MYRAVVCEQGDVRVVVMDSMAQVLPEDAGHIVVCGSHGGSSAAEYALKARVRAAFFNDAGVGKDQAGVRALEILGALDVPACAVSHLSARIGDGRDTWENGRLSHVNKPGERLGLRPGLSVQDAVAMLLRATTLPPRGRSPETA